MDAPSPPLEGMDSTFGASNSSLPLNDSNIPRTINTEIVDLTESATPINQIIMTPANHEEITTPKGKLVENQMEILEASFAKPSADGQPSVNDSNSQATETLSSFEPSQNEKNAVESKTTTFPKTSFDKSQLSISKQGLPVAPQPLPSKPNSTIFGTPSFNLPKSSRFNPGPKFTLPLGPCPPVPLVWHQLNLEVKVGSARDCAPSTSVATTNTRISGGNQSFSKIDSISMSQQKSTSTSFSEARSSYQQQSSQFGHVSVLSGSTGNLVGTVVGRNVSDGRNLSNDGVRGPREDFGGSGRMEENGSRKFGEGRFRGDGQVVMSQPQHRHDTIFNRNLDSSSESMNLDFSRADLDAGRNGMDRETERDNFDGFDGHGMRNSTLLEKPRSRGQDFSYDDRGGVKLSPVRQPSNKDNEKFSSPHIKRSSGTFESDHGMQTGRREQFKDDFFLRSRQETHHNAVMDDTKERHMGTLRLSKDRESREMHSFRLPRDVVHEKRELERVSQADFSPNAKRLKKDFPLDAELDSSKPAPKLRIRSRDPFFDIGSRDPFAPPTTRSPRETRDARDGKEIRASTNRGDVGTVDEIERRYGSSQIEQRQRPRITSPHEIIAPPFKLDGTQLHEHIRQGDRMRRDPLRDRDVMHDRKRFFGGAREPPPRQERGLESNGRWQAPGDRNEDFGRHSRDIGGVGDGRRKEQEKFGGGDAKDFHREIVDEKRAQPPNQRESSAKNIVLHSRHASGSVSSSQYDDTVGEYQGGKGSLLLSRFEVVRRLGRGTFGQVFECVDHQRRRIVAVKVVRRVKRYIEAARVEGEILERVNEQQGPHSDRIVSLLKRFSYDGHECLVFEKLGPSLLDFIKTNGYRPFESKTLRFVARQILEALAFLHDTCGLVHTDLKMENVLFVSEATVKVSMPASARRCGVFPSDVVASWDETKSSSRAHSPRDRSSSSPLRTVKHPYTRPVSCEVKLIDFGGATYDSAPDKAAVINTRQYRGPEVILEMEWSFPSDVWGAGCLFMELFTGDLLFQTHDELEHLGLMERSVGPFSKRFLRRLNPTKRDEFFSEDGWVRLPPRSTSNVDVDRVRTTPRVDLLIRDKADDGDDAGAFTELVKAMLALDPLDRVAARTCLNKAYFVD